MGKEERDEVAELFDVLNARGASSRMPFLRALDRLVALARAGQADTERLEAVVLNQWKVYTFTGMESGSYVAGNAPGGTIERQLARGETARAAIDTALASESSDG